jgi:hypothetical protein
MRQLIRQLIRQLNNANRRTFYPFHPLHEDAVMRSPKLTLSLQNMRNRARALTLKAKNQAAETKKAEIVDST